MVGRGVRCCVAAAAIVLTVPTVANAVDLPPPPYSPTVDDAAAPAPAPVNAASTDTTNPPDASPTPRRRPSLGVGAYGPAVRDLQRELRRRGVRVAVDGAFGPRTLRAVQAIQRRLGLRVSGVADAPLLRRLGVRFRGTASAPRTVVGAPRATNRLKTFPVQGDYSYSDTWGAPRSQGGHEGADIMADRHAPLVAADDAVVAKLSRTETGLGGIYLWLRRADGLQYYYAHMQTIAVGLRVGSRVNVGQVVGTVGNSGDARGGATHVHFEIRQEWTSMNPYRDLVAVDRQRT